MGTPTERQLMLKLGGKKKVWGVRQGKVEETYILFCSFDLGMS